MNDHSHHRQQHLTQSKGLFAALIVVLFFAVIEAVGGLWAGSLALMGDAGHMLTDAFSLGIAAFAAWLVKRPVTERHSFGLGRAEVIAALINGVLMLVVVGGIVIAAIQRIQSPKPVMGMAVVIIALIGLVVNVVVAVILHRSDSSDKGGQNINIRGAMLHVMGDLLSSVAALISGSVIVLTGWTLVDPALSLLICVLILYSSMSLLKEGLHVIMEGVPVNVDIKKVGHAMAECKGVVSVHDLHIWTLRSGVESLSAHIVIDDLSEWVSLLASLQIMLDERFGISHVTLQPEISVHIMHRMRPG